MNVTAYITINNRTYIVGHYSVKSRKSGLVHAMYDLAGILGLRVFPDAAKETRPYLLKHVQDELSTHCQVEGSKASSEDEFEAAQQAAPGDKATGGPLEIDPDTKHPETDTGPAVGKEVW